MPKRLTRESRLMGCFIVADSSVCHGQPTFRRTRILVSDVLEQVASGMAWETIMEEWRGDVSKDAIAEAVRLASQAFLDRLSNSGGPVTQVYEKAGFASSLAGWSIPVHTTCRRH